MPDDGHPTVSRVGLRIVFLNMTEEFRAEVVRRALTEQDSVSNAAKGALKKSIDSSVNVRGFRNTSKASPTYLQGSVANRALYRDDLAGAILKVWAESQKTLHDMVAECLQENALLDGEADYSTNTIPLGPMGPRWDEVMVQLEELHPDLSKDDLRLMSYYVAGRIPGNAEDESESSPVRVSVDDSMVGDGQADGDGEAEQAGLQVDAIDEGGQSVDEGEAYVGEPGPPAGLEAEDGQTDDAEETDVESAPPLPKTLVRILDRLEAVPLAAPQWETIVSFCEKVESIRHRRSSQGEREEVLKKHLRDFAEAHADLLSYLEWNLKEKLEQKSCPWADIGTAEEVIVGLRGLLEEYASVWPRAHVRSEEVERVQRRGEMEKQLDAAWARFEALEMLTYPSASELELLDVEDALVKENTRLLGEYESVEAENHQLKQKVDLLDSDLSESRVLAEMWRIESQQQRRLRTQTPEEPLPNFEDVDVDQVVDLAKDKLKDCLVFSLNSRSDTEIRFDHPRQVWDALKWLATTYYMDRIGEEREPDLDRSIMECCGWHYAPHQSEAALNKYPEEYEAWHNGRKYILGEHIGTGSGRNSIGTIRIAFAWDKDQKKVVIGYVGRHQRTDDG